MNQYFSYPMGSNLGEDLELAKATKCEENEFNNISTEIVPLAKTLISLCASHGIFIKILNRSTIIRRCLINELDFDFTAAFEATQNNISLAHHNFGLAFGVGIYESAASGKLKYVDHQVFYDKVGKIGESIGLTWAGKHPFLSGLRYFEFRPDWAKNMTDGDMMNELLKRRNAQLSLIT